MLSPIIAERCRVWPLTRDAEPDHCREMPSLTTDKRFLIIAERCQIWILTRDAEPYYCHEMPKIPDYRRETLGPIIAERCWAQSLFRGSEPEFRRARPYWWEVLSIFRDAEPDHCLEVFSERCRARPLMRGAEHFRGAEPGHWWEMLSPIIAIERKSHRSVWIMIFVELPNERNNGSFNFSLWSLSASVISINGTCTNVIIFEKISKFSISVPLADLDEERV